MGGLVRIAVIAAATLALTAAAASADHQRRVKRLQRALDHLVEIKGGPPGASAVLYRGGNFPGYTQFTAATRNGRRSVTVSVNRQLAPDAPGIKAPEAFEVLNRDYTLAVCALLG